MKKLAILALALLLGTSLQAQEVRANYRIDGMTHIATQPESIAFGNVPGRANVELVGFPDGSTLYLLYLTLEPAKKASTAAPKGVKMGVTLSNGKLVRLDYVFEKTTQTGWRNYNYSFFGEPEEQPVPVQQNRYARPQPQSSEPEILSEILKLPMLDTTAFRQALYLEVGKPVLAARISNPAYQPDTLTLLFVTATVEDAR